MRGSTNKSIIKLNTAEIKLTQVICFRMGKTYTAKPHRVILKLPFLRIHYYHNKRLQVKESQYLIPTSAELLLQYPIGFVL